MNSSKLDKPMILNFYEHLLVSEWVGFVSLARGGTETKTVGKDGWLCSEEASERDAENLGKHLTIDFVNVNFAFLS